MRISLLAAIDQAGGIGRDGKVPWRLRADQSLFKRLTMAHHILMGRKTFQSIGKLLPGRRMIVLSRQAGYAPPDVCVMRSLEAAVKLAEEQGERELFVIGGSDVYRQALPLAQRLYLTRVHAWTDCQVFFPPIDVKEWLLLEAGYHPQDAKNEYAFDFLRLEKSTSHS